MHTTITKKQKKKKKKDPMETIRLAAIALPVVTTPRLRKRFSKTTPPER
jgi:hypothetical protein